MAFGNILFFAVTKVLDFITLDMLTRKVTHDLILIYPTGRTDIDKELCNGIDGTAYHASDSPHTVALNQHANDLRSFLRHYQT
jgi:hypothetical protein